MWHFGLIYSYFLLDLVPCLEGIRIHVSNTSKGTKNIKNHTKSGMLLSKAFIFQKKISKFALKTN